MRVRHPFRSMPTRAAAVTAAIASTLAVAAGPATAADTAARPGGTQVHVRVADQPLRTLRTWAKRPVGVLKDAGVERTPHDRVRIVRHGRVIQADKNKDVRSGDIVKLVRITPHVTFKRTSIKHHTVRHKTTRLAPGKHKVVASGHRGVRQKRIVRWTRNGHHLRTRVSHRVLKAPAPRRVLVGVRARTVPGTAHLHWKALAHCESGGNPRAVNPAGYYGLYQFSVGTWHSVGGHGMPNHASRGEQTYRAQRLYAQRGRSPWPNCGRYL